MNGRLMRLKRLSKGVSQRELGIMIGVDRTMINHMEAGRRDPSLHTLANLAYILGESMDRLAKNE